jgi:hypothetical protein
VRGREKRGPGIDPLIPVCFTFPFLSAWIDFLEMQVSAAVIGINALVVAPFIKV